MQSKVKIIRTDDGYMVELPNGDYLYDEHGDNLWDTYDAAWDVVATNYADVNSLIEDGGKPRTLLDAQLSAFPDSIVLTDYEMYTALQLEVPDWMDYYKLEEWRYYEHLKKDKWLAERLFGDSLQGLIEETRARWARNALLYKWQTPDGFFYACSRKPDGSYRYVGFRYGLEDSEYASGFDGMGYTPREEK